MEEEAHKLVWHVVAEEPHGVIEEYMEETLEFVRGGDPF